MIEKELERKTRVTDALQVGKEALSRIRRHCVKHHVAVRKVVEHFDVDHDGLLSEDELYNGLHAMHIHPPILREEISNVFAVLHKLGKLTKAGDLQLKAFADSIGVSDELGLYKAVNRHAAPTAFDIQTLGKTPPAFHQADSHPFETTGCTCADQWICPECSTWHRRGKPHWSVEQDQFVEDAVCRACATPRPEPLPVIPCKLLAQDYYRIVGHKPKEWAASKRQAFVIRVQQDEALPINEDWPGYKVRHKVRVINSELAAEKARKAAHLALGHKIGEEEGEGRDVEEEEEEADAGWKVNNAALLAERDESSDEDEGVKQKRTTIRDCHLLSSFVKTRTLNASTALVGTDGGWQVPDSGRVEVLPEGEEGQGQGEGQVARGRAGSPMEEDIQTVTSRFKAGGKGRLAAATASRVTTVRWREGGGEGAAGATLADQIGESGNRAEGVEVQGHVSSEAAGESGSQVSESDRPPTPEISLDQIAYLECLYSKKINPGALAREPGPEAQRYGQTALMAREPRSSGSPLDQAADGGDAERMDQSCGKDLRLRPIRDAGHGGGVFGRSGGDRLKVDAAWNAPTGEALQALAPQGAREAVCGEGGSGGEQKSLTEMWAERKREILQKLGLRALDAAASRHEAEVAAAPSQQGTGVGADRGEPLACGGDAAGGVMQGAGGGGVGDVVMVKRPLRGRSPGAARADRPESGGVTCDLVALRPSLETGSCSGDAHGGASGAAAEALLLASIEGRGLALGEGARRGAPIPATHQTSVHDESTHAQAARRAEQRKSALAVEAAQVQSLFLLSASRFLGLSLLPPYTLDPTP